VVDPGVRAANAKLSKLIRAEQRLNLLGLGKREVTPTQADRLLTSIGAVSKRSKLLGDELKTFQEIIGVDLAERSSLSKAVQELGAGDLFSTIRTGRSLFGLAGGAAIGGPAGAGIALLLGSPAGFRAALRAGRVTKPVIDAFVRAPGVPDEIIKKIAKLPLEKKALGIATFLESSQGAAFQRGLSDIVLGEEQSNRKQIVNPFSIR